MNFNSFHYVTKDSIVKALLYVLKDTKGKSSSVQETTVKDSSNWCDGEVQTERLDDEPSLSPSPGLQVDD